MNNERYKIISDILQNTPNRLRESYFYKNHNTVYNEIINYTKIDLPFKQKIWHWVYEHTFIPSCKCGKLTNFNKNWTNGYKKYCSSKCAQSSKDTKNKRKQTNIKKYGVDNVSKLNENKLKQEKTNLEKYGVKSTFQNKKVREKWKDNIKERYGVEHVFQLEDVKNKIKKTNKEKYGENHFVQSKYYLKKLQDIGFSDILTKNNIIKHIEKYKKIGLEFIDIDNRIITLKGKCGHEFKIHYDSLQRRIENNYEYCTVCNKINSGQSQEEKLLIEWINSLGLELIEKDRSLGFEIDILIPDKNIAIEFNGLYWHSELYKNKNYHINKTKMCLENNIHLIHIWEDDWKFKKDIMKSIILNQLHINTKKIYSRKCKIVELKNKGKNKFLNENHIQGKCNSKINIGLIYKDELVSVMTFGKRNTNTNQEFELIRFCNKKYYNVIGSASKVFSYFTKNYDYNKVVSYADISHFQGKIYEKLNFNYIHTTKPNYWWVVSGLRYHRFTYNKKRLIKEGNDPNKTEVQIMYEKGYFRLFGCGQKRYEYLKN